MSQSSDNPVRQARRRGWASKILPVDDRSRQEMRERAQRLLPAELEEIVQIWLAGIEAAEHGDQEIREFISGMFGPWASELLSLRRS